MRIREGHLVGDVAAAGRRPDSAPRCWATSALTKPRVIELLLVTTIPAMLLADRGTVDPLLILNTLVGGLLAAAGANTLNCVADADIDKMMKRTERRPLARATVPRSHALVFGLALSVGSFFWLWWTTNMLSAHLAGRHHRVLRAGLHAAAQAAHLAERGVGRRGRLHAGDDRLVGGHRHDPVAGAGDVRDHLLLDAAAHLGAGHALQGRLPRGRRADAARGGHRAAGHQADPDLHLADRVGHAGAGAGDRLAVRGGGDRWPAPGSW